MGGNRSGRKHSTHHDSGIEGPLVSCGHMQAVQLRITLKASRYGLFVCVGNRLARGAVIRIESIRIDQDILHLYKYELVKGE